MDMGRLNEIRSARYNSTEAAELIIDLDLAIRSSLFTSEEKVVFGLAYGLSKSKNEVRRLTGWTFKEIDVLMDTAHEKLEALLNGYMYSKDAPYHSTSSLGQVSLDTWIDMVAGHEANPFDPPKHLMKVGKADGVYQEKVGKLEDDYPYYDTSEAIENPNRKYNYRPGVDHDAFRRQDEYYGLGELFDEYDSK